MQPPRPSSTRGLTSRGALLLAATGAGLTTLLFLLPRLSETRAANEPRGTSSIAPEVEARAELPEPELVPPPVAEPDAPPAPIAAEPSPAVETLVAEGQASEEKPKMEGPPMKYIKGSNSQSRVVDGTDPRISNREQRRERRKQAAQGIVPAPAAKQFKEPRDRTRLGNRNGTGLPAQKKPRDS